MATALRWILNNVHNPGAHSQKPAYRSMRRDKDWYLVPADSNISAASSIINARGTEIGSTGEVRKRREVVYEIRGGPPVQNKNEGSPVVAPVVVRIPSSGEKVDEVTEVSSGPSRGRKSKGKGSRVSTPSASRSVSVDNEPSRHEPSWHEPSRNESSWHEPSRNESSWHEPSRNEPSWHEPSRQEPSWQGPSTSTGKKYIPSWMPIPSPEREIGTAENVSKEASGTTNEFPKPAARLTWWDASRRQSNWPTPKISETRYPGGQLSVEDSNNLATSSTCSSSLFSRFYGFFNNLDSESSSESSTSTQDSNENDDKEDHRMRRSERNRRNKEEVRKSLKRVQFDDEIYIISDKPRSSTDKR